MAREVPRPGGSRSAGAVLTAYGETGDVGRTLRLSGSPTLEDDPLAAGGVDPVQKNLPPAGIRIFISYHILHAGMTDYVECPFCDRIFETESYHGLVHGNPLEAHIRTDHAMVKVRKGSNYRWISAHEARRRVAKSG